MVLYRLGPTIGAMLLSHFSSGNDGELLIHTGLAIRKPEKATYL